MFGQAIPCLVYGFNLNTRDIRFDDDWMNSNYPNIECYAIDIVKNCLGEPVYGIECDIDIVTGNITGPSEEEIESLKELYNKYITYYKNNYSENNAENIQLGYHVAVLGWDEENHDQIIPDINEEKSINEEES
jgi:hypothetical protein